MFRWYKNTGEIGLFFKGYGLIPGMLIMVMFSWSDGGEIWSVLLEKVALLERANLSKTKVL